jgi:hypothetical protein
MPMPCRWCSSSLALFVAVAPLPAQSWLSTSPPVAPAARRFHAMVFDDSRGRTLLFGGMNGAGPLFGDTWAFDGASWTQLSPAVSPSARRYHAMAHDRARGRTVLFGGSDGASDLGDTWEHDGTNWTQVVTPSAPPARILPGLAWDAVRRKTVLFGGRTESGTGFGDTWEYDGVAWTLVLASSGPSARHGHALVHDPGRARTVLFGGFTSTSLANGVYLGDTWTYDGSTWTLVAATGPAPRGYHAAAFDPPSGRVLVYGGRGNGITGGHGGGTSYPVYADTWALDGATWTQVAVGTGPAARHSLAMTSGGMGTNAVLFGGGLGATGIETGDTWRLLPAAVPTWSRLGSGCAGASSVPQLDVASGPVPLPVLGSTFTLQLTALPATTGITVLAFATEFAQWNGLPLPVALDPSPSVPAVDRPVRELAAAARRHDGERVDRDPREPVAGGPRARGPGADVRDVDVRPRQRRPDAAELIRATPARGERDRAPADQRGCTSTVSVAVAATPRAPSAVTRTVTAPAPVVRSRCWPRSSVST